MSQEFCALSHQLLAFESCNFMSWVISGFHCVHLKGHGDPLCPLLLHIYCYSYWLPSVSKLPFGDIKDDSTVLKRLSECEVNIAASSKLLGFAFWPLKAPIWATLRWGNPRLGFCFRHMNFFYFIFVYYTVQQLLSTVLKLFPTHDLQRSYGCAMLHYMTLWSCKVMLPNKVVHMSVWCWLFFH